MKFCKEKKKMKMPAISNKIVRMMSPGWPALALRSVDPFGSSSEMQIFKHKQITKMPAVSHFAINTKSYDSEDLDTCAKNLAEGRLGGEARRCLLVVWREEDKVNLQEIH